MRHCLSNREDAGSHRKVFKYIFLKFCSFLPSKNAAGTDRRPVRVERGALPGSRGDLFWHDFQNLYRQKRLLKNFLTFYFYCRKKFNFRTLYIKISINIRLIDCKSNKRPPTLICLNKLDKRNSILVAFFSGPPR
jgi:hypothetical protein